MTQDHRHTVRYNLHLPKDKIIFRLAVLVAIEVLLVVSIFGISTYIESQSTAVGNTINIAGKNRYLTSNFLLELEKVNHGAAHIENLRNATDALNANILFLRSGGHISSPSGDIFLMPLSAKYLDKWYEIREKGSTLNQYVGLLGQGSTTSPISNSRSSSSTNEPQLSSSLSSPAEATIDTAGIETTASQLIASSDDLTRQLSEDDRIYSQEFVSTQTIFMIAAALVGGLILYIMNRLLRPISFIIKATEDVKKGNLSISPIADCDRRDEIGVLAASFNSMIRRLAEYEQRQKDFINIAAHELRTPIQPILGLSATIREEILNLGKQLQMRQGEEAVYKELQNASSATVAARSDSINRSSSSLTPSIEKIVLMADVMNRNAKRLEKMTSNLLDVSRIENNKPLELNKERFDLGKKIQNVINDICSTTPDNKERRIKFESNVNKASIIIEGDKERIFEVISNLLNNAIKFTEKGEVIIVLNERDGQAIVSVRDTGSGIAPEIYPNLFTKFATKSEKGTGLGLFLAKNIVEAHGGKIGAENNSDGKGATFSFSMPILTYDKTTETRINEKKL
jgi:signal transduction histidine kinase